MDISIEPGIQPVCDALNSISGVSTLYSCEGHATYLSRPYVMFAASQELALRIHQSLGSIGHGLDGSLKYCWWIEGHFQDDGSMSYCLEPNDVRVTGRTSWTFPAWRRSMNRELIRLARVIQQAQKGKLIMEFKNSHGQVIEFDPMDQASIDAAKAQAPGEGIGPAVARALTNKMATGEITKMSQLPSEYRQLGKACGLPA